VGECAKFCGSPNKLSRRKIKTIKTQKVKKAKADIALHGSSISELWDVTCHMGSQCYLPPDTSESTPPNPSHAGWYSIYLARRDGRLS